MQKPRMISIHQTSFLDFIGQCKAQEYESPSIFVDTLRLIVITQRAQFCYKVLGRSESLCDNVPLILRESKAFDKMIEIPDRISSRHNGNASEGFTIGARVFQAVTLSCSQAIMSALII